MTRRFVDEYLDPQVPGFPCYSSPKFNNTITAAAGGDEAVNRNWLHPLRTFRLPNSIREHATYETLHNHWLVMGGDEACWPFRDPMDFASCPLTASNVEPDFTGTDQVLGLGDGLQRTFQLAKTYARGGSTYTRPIYLPVLSSLLILVGGVAYDDPAAPGGPYTLAVTRPGGEVTFTPALANGQTATWGGLFDVITRFEASDSFDGIVQSYLVSGFGDLVLQEVRKC